MLLLPLVHEDTRLRRVPVVSVALVALNVVMLVVVTVWTDDRALVGRVGQVIGYLREHPYLDASPAMARLLGADFSEEAGLARREGTTAVPAIAVFELERLELERREQRVMDELRALPGQRLGFTPARPWGFGLLSSLFIHAGWVHLLGNLLFLWITAPFLEERLGRATFLALYLACGLAANGAHALRYPSSDVPLVGASGAIAGLMGAFLVYFATTRIRFLVIPTPVTVSLPALVVFPLWLAEQMVFARYLGEETSVAFMAHVGGFVFGVGAALILKVAGAGAREEQADHRAADGKRLRAQYDAAVDSADMAVAAAAALRVLEGLQAAGATQEACDFVGEVHEVFPAPVPIRLWQSCAALLERHDVDGALALYQELIDGHPKDAACVRALIRRGDLLRRQGEREDARRAYEKARAHQECTPAAAEAIARSLALLGRA